MPSVVVDEIRRAVGSGADSRSLWLPAPQARTTDDRSLAVRIYEYRFAGGANFPCIMLTVAVENLADRNAFVDEVEVIAEAPFQGQAVEYQFREARVEGKTKDLPINIPAGGLSDRFKVLACFENGFLSPTRQFHVKIAAIGPFDFKPAYSPLAGRISDEGSPEPAPDQ